MMARTAGLGAVLLCTVAWGADAQVSAQSDLVFGTLVAGTTTTVAPTGPNTASWRIDGLVGAGTGFTITLPTSLSRVGGGATLPIDFCAACGIYRANSANPVGGTTFNPHNPVSLPMLVALTTYYVWIGGSITPPVGQMPGAYSGTVVLTVTGIIL